MPGGRRQRLARLAAPVAFLLGVTIAVLLVRSGLGGSSQPTTTLGPVTHAVTSTGRGSSTPATGSPTTTGAAARYVTVASGDTFGSIAASAGTSVARIEELNPGVSSNALHVGQRIRVR